MTMRLMTQTQMACKFDTQAMQAVCVGLPVRPVRRPQRRRCPRGHVGPLRLRRPSGRRVLRSDERGGTMSRPVIALTITIAVDDGCDDDHHTAVADAARGELWAHLGAVHESMAEHLAELHGVTITVAEP